MNRTCPVCASKSVPFGQFLLSHRWRPVICSNCGARCRIDVGRSLFFVGVAFCAFGAEVLVKVLTLRLGRPSLLMLKNYTWFIPIVVSLGVGVIVWVCYVIVWRIPLNEMP